MKWVNRWQCGLQPLSEGYRWDSWKSLLALLGGDCNNVICMMDFVKVNCRDN